MRALWAAPPAVLIAGAGAVVIQLWRIAASRSALADLARMIRSDQAGLASLKAATERTRASLEGLEHR
jgi:hypothetical protein